MSLAPAENSKQTSTMDKLQRLGRELLTSRAHVNNAPVLLSALASSIEDGTKSNQGLEALLSLQAFFLPLLRTEIASSTVKEASERLKRKRAEGQGEEEAEGDAEAIYRNWLRSKYAEFLAILRKIVASPQPISSLRVHSKVFDDVILGALVTKYLKYRDICLLTVIRNVYDFLSHIPPPSGEDTKQLEEEMWKGASTVLLQCAKYASEHRANNQQDACARILTGTLRSKMSKAWMSFLRLPLPLDVYKKILAMLHKTVVPYLTKPILLSDFLTRSYDIGGVISVMALNSLFILLTQHGLEYPDFYNQLYALLEPSIFMAKYRSHFFELLDACLKSPLLPAYLAAAFAKKMSRLSLYAPPAGSLVVIAMIHNLLRRHPSINCLVHQQDLGESDEVAAIKTKDLDERVDKSGANLDPSMAKPGADPFLSEEKDTVKCKALKSSLWEIETLRRHYCPVVSRFVASLENDLTIRAKTTEVTIKDFSSGSYGTIFSEEVGRRIKQVPLAFYKTIPSSLFPEQTAQNNNSDIDFAGWNFTPYFEMQKQIDESIGKNNGQDQLEQGSKDGLR